MNAPIVCVVANRDNQLGSETGGYWACDPTLARRVLAGDAGSTLLLLAKEASNRGLDALLLGCLVERVLAAVAAAGVAALAVLQAGQTVGEGERQ